MGVGSRIRMANTKKKNFGSTTLLPKVSATNLHSPGRLRGGSCSDFSGGEGSKKKNHGPPPKKKGQCRFRASSPVPAAICYPPKKENELGSFFSGDLPAYCAFSIRLTRREHFKNSPKSSM